MAWKQGESGNPSGATRVKKFLGALERALSADDGKKLRQAADKLLDLASQGEPWAIAMLADRLDGKATQQIEMAVQRQVREIDDAELADIAAGSRDRASSEAQSTEVPSALH